MSSLPKIPTMLKDLVSYISRHPKEQVFKLLKPYDVYESKLREIFAQDPTNPLLQDPHINTVPVFNEHINDLKIRARDLQADPDNDKYIMPLKEVDRKPNGAPAVVQSIKEFQNNFNIFSELALSDLDWSNIVAAGSSVLTPLLPVPEEYSGSKRALRQYYHEKLAPASDIDLFIYGLNEQEAIEKIKQIETKVRDSILQETTTVRTKHAITIVSQYPTRHIQIVLRLYKSISEILTGFDVNCSCVAYDGTQVFAAPRAIGALVTQINQVDLSRRSPSYEARLSKYSHRGFEVYWPQLDRSKVDPTIFERSFTRTLGLARLLVLEQLPKEQDRADYSNKRRQERGRPLKREDRRRRLFGNIKDGHEDEIAEWVLEDDAVANYHTFTIPYGEKFNARRIEKLLYTKDLLLNAEWNTKQREVNLHRHPAFFGDAENIVGDCCGFCPKPITDEDVKVAEEESKIYVSGNISFLTDDPGRQTIGSFNPITDTDWTEMAYVGNTARLCESIVDCDLEVVQDCLKEGIDPNSRDYTGRTPLHLAVMNSSPEIVQCLLESGAYLMLRLADGRNAMHLAATRGDVEIIAILNRKNQQNMALAELAARDEPTYDKESEKDIVKPNEDSDDGELLDNTDLESESASEASADLGASTFIKVESCKRFLPGSGEPGDKVETSKLEPKDDIIDANLAAWDSGCTPHHLAIALGHHSSLEYLIKSFGSNPGCPVKLTNRHVPDAILGLVLALKLPAETFEKTAHILLETGAKCSQADLKGFTAFHYYANHGPEMIDFLMKNQRVMARSVMNWIVARGSTYNPQYSSPICSTIENHDIKAFQRLVDLGAKLEVEFEPWMQGLRMAFKSQIRADPEKNLEMFKKHAVQPIILAVQCEQPAMVRIMLDKGIDMNTLTIDGQSVLLDTYSRSWKTGSTLLDRVREKLSELKQHDVENEAGARYLPGFPLPLKNDEHYFEDLSEGSYEHWATSELIKDAKKTVQRLTESYKQNLESRQHDKGVSEKKNAIAELIERFEKLEQELVKKGAKTFTELHPDVTTAQRRPAYVYGNRAVAQPVETKVVYSFRVADLTDAKREAYIRLFEAVWTGDDSTVKSLTTLPQGPHKSQPPLNISVSDTLSNTPLSIAIARGHLDLATTILDIIQAQYVPGKKEMSYTMNNDETDESDSEDSVDNEERIQLYERLPTSVRNHFTIDDIGEISTLVKSDVSPLQALRQTHQVGRLIKDDPNEVKRAIKINAHCPGTLIGYAIHTDDMKLLSLLLDAGAKYQSSEGEDSDAKCVALTLTPAEFRYAIAMGRVKLLAEIIRRTGSGLPLDELVQKSGVEIKETSKYYTGLSIRGSKRKDWAEAYQNKQTVTKYVHHPPLLEAARAGNIDAIEWFMSDAPLRLYSDFSEANRDDPRLKSLNQAAGGFDKMVMNWLDTRSDLMLHCAVISRMRPGLEKFVSDLIKTTPSSLNARSSDGLTPLHLAFSHRREELAKILLEAGADPTIRDSSSKNLIHTLFIPYNATSPAFDYDSMDRLMALLDPTVRTDMLLQRNSYSSGAMTPLHAWLHLKATNTSLNNDESKSEETLKTLLKYSNGEELGMIDGSGDTPIHTAVAMNQKELLRILLHAKPQSIWRENAVGRTPAEVAQDRWLADRISRAPALDNSYYGGMEENKRPILQRSLAHFVKDSTAKKAPVDEIWEICKEHMERHPGKRKLVSLNEANEVAKRLAESDRSTFAVRHGRAYWKSLRSGRGNEGEEEKGKDEVAEWYWEGRA